MIKHSDPLSLVNDNLLLSLANEHQVSGRDKLHPGVSVRRTGRIDHRASSRGIWDGTPSLTWLHAAVRHAGLQGCDGCR
jgi:hypothetical protein